MRMKLTSGEGNLRQRIKKGIIWEPFLTCGAVQETRSIVAAKVWISTTRDGFSSATDLSIYFQKITVLFGTMYSRIDEGKFVERSL